ncbi:MAG: hypothetical protein ABW166_04820 [Sedimenticola sp.]
MTHFMKPHFLDQEQKSALETATERLDVGDEKSWRIFIIALDYELTEYDKLHRRERPKTEVSDDNLEKIAAAAGALSDMLQQLPKSSYTKLSQQLSEADDFARQYSGRYLSALQDEVERVSVACRSKAVIHHGLGVERSDQHLVAMIVKTYRECFEREPLEDDRALFLDLLGEIIGICGLDIEGDLSVLLDVSQREP